MKHKISLCISALAFITAFLITMSSHSGREEALASPHCAEILRFHILAESDSTMTRNEDCLKGLCTGLYYGQVLPARTTPNAAGTDR